MSDKSCRLAVTSLALAGLLSLCPINMVATSAAFAAGRDAVNEVAVVEQCVNNRTYQVSREIIHARPEQVWQVLTDFRSAPQVFSSLKKCEVLQDHGATKVIRQTLHPTGTFATFEYDLEIKLTPARYMEWHRVAGDFKEVNGFWKLEPLEGGRSTMVTYANAVNGGFLMPQPFIRRQSRIDFPRVMAALKTRSEGATEIAAHGATHAAN